MHGAGWSHLPRDLEYQRAGAAANVERGLARDEARRAEKTLAELALAAESEDREEQVVGKSRVDQRAGGCHGGP